MFSEPCRIQFLTGLNIYDNAPGEFASRQSHISARCAILEPDKSKNMKSVFENNHEDYGMDLPGSNHDTTPKCGHDVLSGPKLW